MNKLWVHFNLLCDGATQRRLHKIFRHKVKDWEKQELVKEVVLTYHTDTGSFYLCLDIPAVKKPDERNLQLSEETIEQIPSQILNSVKQICGENQVTLKIRDYELALQKQKAKEKSQGKPYYRGAPVKEILRFASVGARIADQILDLLETGERPWTIDKELARFILSRLKEVLGEDYPWLREGFHFVCNPLGFSNVADFYLWSLANSETVTEALDFLYFEFRRTT